MTMAPHVKHVWGLELVEDAIMNAKKNAVNNGVGNVSFVAANARTGLGPLLEEAGKPDVITIDPPRAGLSAEDRAPPDRVRGAAHRLHLLQPDHARPECWPSWSRPVINSSR